jgi:hypothetical protein
MTSDEFVRLLGRQTDQQLLGPCLLDDLVPYVFAPKPATWDAFRDELVSLLGVSKASVRVVGSGRFGFSTRPWNNFAIFDDRSDIDVVIVNATAFDALWFSLLDAAYPRPPLTRDNNLGGWLIKRRNEVYTGWITPLAIQLDKSIYGAKAKPVLEVRHRWFNALRLVSRHPPLRHEGVKARLYRTWRHAKLYHLDSLSALRKSLGES